MNRQLITLLALFSVVLMSGCATEKVPIRAGVQHLPHFSFATPKDDIWIEEQLIEKDKIVFTTRRGAVEHRFTLLEKVIFDKGKSKASAKDVADEYRNGEKNIMIVRGVKEGLYELFDIVTGQERFGDKLYYTMKYWTNSEAHCESAWLFLYFPHEYLNDQFLVAHYSEAAPTCDLLTFSLKSNVLRILRTVNYTMTESEPRGKVLHERIPQGSLMNFFAGAYTLTQLGLPRPELNNRCQEKMNGKYVTFIGLERMTFS